MTPPLAVGDLAPDFELSDTHGSPVRLAALRGEAVMLVFVPLAFTGRCTGEVCELSENLGDFERAGVRVLGITCDPTPAQRVWQEQEGLTFDLLSDFWPHGEVARRYGVFDEDSGMAVRGTFVVDPDMRVRWSLVNGPGEQRDIGVLHRAVRDL